MRRLSWGAVLIFLIILSLLGNEAWAFAGLNAPKVNSFDPQGKTPIPGRLHDYNATSGDTFEFTGTISDGDGETQLSHVRIATVAGPVVSSERAIVAADLTVTGEPAYGGDNWKIWNPILGGPLQLSYKFRFTFPTNQAASYQWRASVKDGAAQSYLSGPAEDVNVTVFLAVTVAANPVLGDGTPNTGARWGAWTANPSATNVEATNYIKLTNTGLNAGQAWIIDFSSTAFTGVTDATKTINLDNNIQFASWQDTTPATTSPDEGTYTFGATSATGSVTASFTGTGNIFYVKYRVVTIPAIVVDQAYESAYTVSQL